MKKSLISLFVIFLSGCGLAMPKLTPTAISQTSAVSTNVTATSEDELSAYAFPISIDLSKQFLFYLHGKIIEDQGIHAVSPDYGAYEYEEILAKFASYGFVVISEQREKNTDAMKYADRIVGQATELLNAGVSPENITVIGASKGAYIAALVSNLLKNSKVDFVLLGTCHPTTIEEWKQNRTFLFGNVLAIYDSVDEYSGSCKELFELSTRINRHEEIVLHIGAGHGILYKPLDEWILPAVQWAEQ